MELNELLTFIEKQKDLLQSQYKNVEESKMTLAMTVKLSEEVGELSQEILGNLSLVRKEKLNRHNPETLSDEFADVLITTLILAKKMNVDVKKALESKIDKLDKRNGLEKDWWR